MTFDLETDYKIGTDVVNAFKAAPNAATGVGAAIRAAAVSPMSHGIERFTRGAAPIASGVGDFMKGLVFGESSAKPVPSPRSAVTALAPAVVGPNDPRAMSSSNIIRGSSPPLPTPAAAVTAPAPALAATAAPTSYRAPAPSQGPAMISFAPEEVNPAFRRDAEDPNKTISDLYNNGTWSGMANAKMLARRVDADRADAVSRSSAETARIGAQTGQLSAITNAMRARTDARKSAAEEGLINENAALSSQTRQSNAVKMEGERDEADLRKAAAAGDEKAIVKLRNISAAKQGKAPDDATNEKLLNAYAKSIAEFNKDPDNRGRAAPTFQDFLRGLPPGMFPSASKATGTPLPQGMQKQIGTSNGNPVYEGADGKRYTV